jgi:hypothetical protein|tara:strand:- start:2063 stop:4507 length:2445 start_codon:yes stop_codon:yes gene_type:complete
MGENAKSGHTQALTDGDYILSPSITNLFEGVHGNGILMYEDTATGDSNRNAKATTPGLVTDNGTNSIIVRGGFAVLDGMIVPFGNINSGATTTITLQQSTIEGSTSALSSGESCLLVVYVCSNANTNYIQIEQGSAVSSGFPITPESFLGDTSGLNGGLTLSSKQSTVLAVVKCQHNSSAGDLNLEVTEVFDMRTFIRPSPIYLSPMTSGSVGNQSNRMDSAADLDGMHGGGDEVGGLSSSNFGALWQSYSFGTDGTDGDHVLYFSGKQGGSRRTHRLGPNKISVLNTSQTVRFDGPNIFNATPASGDINITPSGTFPPSHMIIVNNAQTSTHKVIFDPSGLSSGGATVGDVGPSSSAIFVYTGSAWVKVFASSTTTSTASGSAGAIQLSDGSASFTNDTDLSFTTGTNTLNTINLTMTGLLSGPSGVSFKSGVTSNPASSGPDARTLWYDDGNDVLKFNASIVQTGDINLNSVSGGTINVAADSIVFIDADDNASKKESIADLATAMAGTGISASSGALNLDAAQTGITSIGPSSGILTVSDDLTVAGDLIVNGTTTTVNSTTVTVDDVILTLGGDTAPGSDDNKDRGIEFRYHDGSSARVGFFGYDDSASNFVFLTAATNSSEVFSGTKGTIDANLTGGSVSATTITGSGDLNIDSGKLFVDVSESLVGINQATPLADLHVNKVGFGSPASVNTTSSSTGTPLTIDLYKTDDFKAGKLLVSVENHTDVVYEAAEMVITHNGRLSSEAGGVAADATAAFLSTYGIVTSDTTQQGTYQIGLTGSGATQKLQLQVTPTVNSKNVTVRVTWQALEI